MSQSDFTCRACAAILGNVSTGRPLHLVGGAAVAFIDRDADRVTVRCPHCGAKTSVRARRIEMSGTTA